VLEGLAGPGGVRTEGTGLVVDLNGSRPSDVAAVLVRAGVGLEAMTPRRRLEDVFLGLIEDGRGPQRGPRGWTFRAGRANGPGTGDAPEGPVP